MAALSLPGIGQTKNFKAACLNVDGLPPSITIAGLINITLNPDGAREAGSERISELIAQKGWDFFAVSEDFNYHNELISRISDYYNVGTYRGEVSSSNTTLSGKLKINTDGLGLMWKKSINASNEAWTKWSSTNGYTTNGADELIMKGYRYYCVTVANGLSIDVYIHHMDAETDAEDIAARESQINQLVDVILASDNHRPILIMGDTNCRYTRDRLKELLFDRINADERFEIHDPWVDFQWDGVYPEYGSDALMTSDLGQQKGEVVDKVFYINNNDANGVVLTANSYLHDTDFSYADGTSISDHYPVVIDFTIQNTSNNISEGSYYLRNVKSGEYLNAGSYWGTHAIVGETGNYISLERAGEDNQYYLHTTYGYLSHDSWMDAADKAVYTVSKSDDGNYVVTYDADGETMALTALDNNEVYAQAYVKDDAAQEWAFLSQDDLVKELYAATEASPKDATFFIKAADFSRNDGDYSKWSISKSNGLNVNRGGLNDGTAADNYIVEFYNKKASLPKSNGTMTQTAEGLPNGKYRISVQAFQRDGSSFSISANGTNIPVPMMADYAQDTQLHADAILYDGKYVPNTIASAAAFFNAGLYTTTADFTITDHQLSILINKEHNSSEKWSAFDNFRLIYLGPTDEDNAAYVKVKQAMDDAQEKAEAMSLYNYDNSVVEERYYNRQLVGDGDEEVKMTYIALANASKSQNQIPADMRYVLLNNSFEMGDYTYWTAEDGSVDANAEALDADGVYTFTGSAVSQSTDTYGIVVKNGTYEAKALLSNGGKLTANEVESEAAVAEDGALAEVAVKFYVSAGTISVSASGMASADNFMLTYLSEEDETIEDDDATTGIAVAPITSDTLVSVYSVNGVMLKRDVTLANALEDLASGVYIVRSGAAVLKLMK
jgi:endonuclease/exonuclease/phosphatase family metal-dependent hydrolase